MCADSRTASCGLLVYDCRDIPAEDSNLSELWYSLLTLQADGRSFRAPRVKQNFISSTGNLISELKKNAW